MTAIHTASMRAALVLIIMLIMEAALLLKPAAAQLAGSEWRPTEIDGAEVAAEPEIFIQFGAEGAVAGHSGCNRFFGSVTLNDGRIEFGPMGSTRMACPQPLMDLEQVFLTTLSKAAGFERERIHLSLSDEAGHVIMQLIQTDAD